MWIWGTAGFLLPLSLTNKPGRINGFSSPLCRLIAAHKSFLAVLWGRKGLNPGKGLFFFFFWNHKRRNCRKVWTCALHSLISFRTTRCWDYHSKKDEKKFFSFSFFSFSSFFSSFIPAPNPFFSPFLHIPSWEGGLFCGKSFKTKPEFTDSCLIAITLGYPRFQMSSGYRGWVIGRERAQEEPPL